MSAITAIDERQSLSEAGEAARAVPAHVAVSVNHVSKTFSAPLKRLRQFIQRRCIPPVEALRDVTFDIREGEIFGIIGPNGAGKTTLTKIVATLVRPSSGTVTVSGYDSVWEDDSVRRQVGLASAEERSFYWRLTVTQNLLFFARLYGMSDGAARRRIGELLARLGLEEYACRRYGEMSSGNKQRVALARALIGSPPVVLLDEPTRSLDPLAAASMRAVIRSLAREDPPVSVLLTSHNLAEVEELCARVAVLSRGQVRALDTPQRLRASEHQSERLHLTVRGVTRECAEALLADRVEGLVVTQVGAELLVTFTRLEKDECFDLVVRTLHEAGASVLAVDSERASLLNVIENYEREHGRQDWCETRC